LTVGAGTRTDLQPLSEMTKVDARRLAAEKAGVSGGTVSAMKAVIEAGNDDLLQSVLRGETSVTAAARCVKQEGNTPCLPFDAPVFTVVDGNGADAVASTQVNDSLDDGTVDHHLDLTQKEIDAACAFVEAIGSWDRAVRVLVGHETKDRDRIRGAVTEMLTAARRILEWTEINEAIIALKSAEAGIEVSRI
jgi:hypothetical protein